MRKDRGPGPEPVRQQTPVQHSLEYTGMVVFLGAWAMLFAALFFAYVVLRIGARAWPPFGVAPLPLELPAVGTLVLLGSGGTLASAQVWLRRGQWQRARTLLSCTVVLGAVFVGLQFQVWAGLWKQGLHLDSGAYGGIFYTLTGLHVLHVLVGLGSLAALLIPGRLQPAEGQVPLTLVSMFWQFLVVAGVVLFGGVYLL
jgi:cytochrome c oxidase subunit III